jgi:hypothetical protein
VYLKHQEVSQEATHCTSRPKIIFHQTYKTKHHNMGDNTEMIAAIKAAVLRVMAPYHQELPALPLQMKKMPSNSKWRTRKQS